ncbi:MAG TPA: hypothetical protein VFT21_05145 [Gemmatimonadaceae bacterium]|nr:hypothetical protein [Gemmatimonadaceae bacterium]
MHHTVSSAGYMAKCGDRRVGGLSCAIDDDRQQLAAAKAASGRAAIP